MSFCTAHDDDGKECKCRIPREELIANSTILLNDNMECKGCRHTVSLHDRSPSSIQSSSSVFPLPPPPAAAPAITISHYAPSVWNVVTHQNNLDIKDNIVALGGPPLTILDGYIRPFITPLQMAAITATNGLAIHPTNAHYEGLYVIEFLFRRLSAQRGENNDHYRNDCLMWIIRHVGGLASSRDLVQSPTADRVRLDVSLSFQNFPPLVVSEEKASQDDLQKAQEEIIEKFRWLDHYTGKTPYVVGIAIAGNIVRFGTVGPPGSVGGACMWTHLADFDLDGNTLDGGWQAALDCIVAAINVGRWCRWIYTNPPLPLSIPFNTTVKRGLGKEIHISYAYVLKTYRGFSRPQQNAIKRIYEATESKNPIDTNFFLERAIDIKMHFSSRVTRQQENFISVRLTPVGSSTQPTNPADVRRCVWCILTALERAHSKQIVIIDVRPQNIMRYRNHYYLIDIAELASLYPIGSNASANAPALPAGVAWPPWVQGNHGVGGLNVSPALDLFMMSVMLTPLHTQIAAANAHGPAFVALLAGINNASTATGLLADVYFTSGPI